MTDTDTPKAPTKTKKYARKTERKPAKLSESYFYNSALYYLQRYASTEANLHTVLNRKVFRTRQRGGDVPPETPQWIAKAVTKCVALGYINDRIYAESRLESMRREGKSTRFIAQNLQQKGVSRDLVAELLESDDSENEHNHELESALRTIRRRNMLRPDRLAQMDQEQRREHDRKNLARLLRAGFSMNTARQALQQAAEQITQ